MKKYYFKIWLISFLTITALTQQAQEVIIGYSGIFTLGTQINEVTPVLGYTDIFPLNTMLGSSFDAYSGLFNFNTIGAPVSADFTANDTVVEINEEVQFTYLPSKSFEAHSWLWNFGDGTPVSTVPNPTHTYSTPAIYNVTLTVENLQGVQNTKTKENYINVNSQNNGIYLKIIKTDPNAGPVIAKAGYYYTIKENGVINDTEKKTFDIVNGEVHINSFPTSQEMPNGTELKSAFNNEIIFFDQDDKQIGHIKFDYERATDKQHIRNAILFLHNDSEMCIADGKTYFPYSNSNPDFDPNWQYYKLDEYPVSMLIPPNNTFISQFIKQPLLFIHGWEGWYYFEKSPDAKREDNEVSYWFTTVKGINDFGIFDAWQFYYPYNTDHLHIAYCLKEALIYLNEQYDQKIRLVTHSMGGLVTMRYVTEFNNLQNHPEHIASNFVEKVFFSSPPSHGSLGANLYHKTEYGPDLEIILKYDSEAPAVRDLKIGSNAINFIQSNPWSDLNGSGTISDDYFVLLGTTYKFYKSDLYVYMGGIGLHSCLHEEAQNHHDGIVSISSGSLLDKGISFATFHGNHNDAVHMQSYKRYDPSNQNIGKSELLPIIINQYFTKNYVSFLDWIKENQDITAFVAAEGTNRIVFKPFGQNLGNLNTNNGVNYQKGILNLEINTSNNPEIYYAYYSGLFKRLYLLPGTRATAKQALMRILGLDFFHCISFGSFIKNGDVNNGNRYYFNKDDNIDKGIGQLLYKGCAMELKQGTNKIIIFSKNFRKLKENFDFRFCETTSLVVNPSKSYDLYPNEDNTDFKIQPVVNQNISLTDSILASFFIDDQTSNVEFVISGLPPQENGPSYNMKLRDPEDNEFDTTYLGGTFSHDYELGEYTMILSNPIPGKWFVWAESNASGTDTLQYQAIAYLKSKLHAYVDNQSENAAAGSNYKISAGLKMDTLSLADSLSVKATIYKPSGISMEMDLNTIVPTDSSFVFEHNYLVDSAGYYLVKFNLNGIYNGYRFERALWHQFEAVDTIPLLYMPDVDLRQNEHQKALDLSQFTFNIDNYDTLYFTSEIISSNLDTSAFSAALDSLSLTSYFYTNLSDSGTVVMRFTCHFNDNEISDTVVVKVLLPEMTIGNIQLSDSIVSNATTLTINYDLGNSGNYDAGEYEVRYFISQDSEIQPSDNCLGIKTILYHNVDTVLAVFDTIQLPVLDLVGNYHLLMNVDATDQIREIDESNNLAIKDIYLNPAPATPVIISAAAVNDIVQLTWTSFNEPGITGYIIYYGTDTTDVLNMIYPLSNDTSYSVAGLINGNTYYFALEAYKIMGINSERSSFVPATVSFCSVSIRLFLEGNFNGSNAMTTDLNEFQLIPSEQPYNSAPWSYSGTENVSNIPNPNIVDWVLVELRDAPDAASATQATTAGRQAAFLLSNGSVVGMDGSSNLEFSSTINYQLFVVVWHRNHLPVMSANPLILTDGVYSCDFTTSADMAYGGMLAQKQIAAGVWGMMAGDCDANGEINPTDEDLFWESNAGNAGYISTDLNLDGQVDNKDKDDLLIPNIGKGSQVPE